MILLEDILLLHDASIRDYGGMQGIRDIGLLDTTPIEKAAALSESLIINHPFLDGNKRTGLLGMLTILLEYKLEINVTEGELYNLIIQSSTGETKFDEIVAWINNNAAPF